MFSLWPMGALASGMGTMVTFLLVPKAVLQIWTTGKWGNHQTHIIHNFSFYRYGVY